MREDRSLPGHAQNQHSIKSLLGDHYLWSDHKKRNQILIQFAAASFVIAEIMRYTKLKLVAYISHLLGSNSVKYNLLGEGMKEMLNITGPSKLNLTH